jgi:hypothetical protein
MARTAYGATPTLTPACGPSYPATGSVSCDMVRDGNVNSGNWVFVPDTCF